MRGLWWAIGLGCGSKDESGHAETARSTPPTGETESESESESETEPQAPTCAVSSIVAAGNPVMVTELEVTYTSDGAGPTEVWCTTAADGAEAHLAEAADPSGAVIVRGLLADTEWLCTAWVTCADGTVASASTSLATGPLPSLLPEWEVSRDDDLPMSGAYTLFNDSEICDSGSGEDRLVIVDPDGRVRWYHLIPEDLEADVDANYLGDGVIYYGGGWGLFEEGADNRGASRWLDLSGVELASREAPDFGLGFNHHSEILPDGRVLSLTTSEHDDAGGSPMYGVAIEEWDPSTESVTWSWDSAEAVAAGVLDRTESALDGRMNANSVTAIEDEDGPALYVSEYYASHIFRVDRASGLVTWVLGPGGDFSLLAADGSPLPEDAWFYNQHEPEWDGDRVVLHDNGTDRPVDNDDKFSRVLELEVDVVARTATVVWEWTEEGWFEPILGDADRIEGGHVLVTQGHCACCWWRGLGNPEGNVSTLVEVDVTTGGVAWRLDWPDADAGGFRAERYDGCALFSNAAYCGDVAARRP